jgi:hypothetical protein
VACAGEFPDISLLNISAVFWNSPLVSFWSGLAGAACRRESRLQAAPTASIFAMIGLRLRRAGKRIKFPVDFPKTGTAVPLTFHCHTGNGAAVIRYPVSH